MTEPTAAPARPGVRAAAEALLAKLDAGWFRPQAERDALRSALAATPARPTREQVRQIIEGAYRRPMTTSEWMDAAADAVMALIGGDDA